VLNSEETLLRGVGNPVNHQTEGVVNSSICCHYAYSPNATLRCNAPRFHGKKSKKKIPPKSFKKKFKKKIQKKINFFFPKIMNLGTFCPLEKHWHILTPIDGLFIYSAVGI
jgi:hypothetical protein